MSAYEMPSQQPGPGQYGQHGHQASAPGKGMAVTALVLGVLALLLCWTVVGGVLLGLPAAILGLVAVLRARKGKAGGRGLAIAGLVTGVLGIVLGILTVVLLGSLVARLLDGEAAQRYEQCVTDSDGSQGAVDRCDQQLQRDLEEELPG